MADLSNLLGDVYGDDPEGERVGREPPAEGRDEAPAWADESVLDAAFANWTPGPPLDAPAAERDVFATSADPASAAPLPDDLAAALSAALVGPRAHADVPVRPAPEDLGLTPSPLPSPLVEAPFEGPASWAQLAATPREVAHGDDPFAGAMPLIGQLPWQRGDDDILPRRGSSSRRALGNLGLGLRRR